MFLWINAFARTLISIIKGKGKPDWLISAFNKIFKKILENLQLSTNEHLLKINCRTN
jgi:hypothetical protein